MQPTPDSIFENTKNHLTIFSSFIFRSLLLFLSITAVTAAKNFEHAPNASFSAQKSFSSNDITINITAGNLAPDFSLTGANKQEIKLSDFLNKKNILLVFYRGSWCPYCISHFDDIQNVFPELKKHNVQLLAISPDSDEKSRKLAKRFRQPYIFLSDPDLSTAKNYGVQRDKNLPHPTVVLINKEGIVVWYYTNSDYKQRPSGLQLKSVIENLL